MTSKHDLMLQPHIWVYIWVVWSILLHQVERYRSLYFRKLNRSDPLQSGIFFLSIFQQQYYIFSGDGCVYSVRNHYVLKIKIKEVQANFSSNTFESVLLADLDKTIWALIQKKKGHWTPHSRLKLDNHHKTPSSYLNVSPHSLLLS